MLAPRVLIVLDTFAAWSRGVLRGFTAVANEHRWTLLHYHPTVDLDWLVREWSPAAAVIGPASSGRWPTRLASCPLVSVNADRSAEGMASVCLDEGQIAELALAHLLAKGLKHLTTFRFDDASFAVARERCFCQRGEDAGAKLPPAWWVDGADPPRSREDPAAIASWLRGLPRPCGVFAVCDPWARVVARYAQISGLRVPEDLAIVGVDNDTIECEITAPPLSSVAVPWRRLGETAAQLVRSALAGQSIAGERVVIPGADVVARRSTDVLAVDDPIVAAAVSWIHANADRRLTVPVITRAVSTTRQRLERRFRAVLGRTIIQEVRRAHVEVAKRLLSTTDLNLFEVARRSGFTNSSLLSVAFQREVGTSPGAYRRRAAGLDFDDD
jgi:LacI family transcriptional regulator